jgi:hypothetical protein
MPIHKKEVEMSMLSNFKLVVGKREKSTSPVLQRRLKLSNKIYEQIQLAEAKKQGSTYEPIRVKTVVNKVTGERHSIEAAKRIREWWFINDAGKINLQIRYGSKPIALDAKGTKNAIEISSGDELIEALKTLKVAVEQGELDAQIESTSGALRAGFLK